MRKICILLLVFALFSCSKDDDKDNDKDQKEILDGSNVIITDEFECNSFSSFIDIFGKKWYDYSEMDSTKSYDFCFFDDDFYYVGYLLISPSHKVFKHYSDNFGCEKKTIFYNLSSNFRKSSFDTIQTCEGLKDVINKGSIVINEGIRYGSDGVFSGEYGWSNNQMFGMKFQNGKFGIICITNIDRRAKVVSFVVKHE